MLEQLLPIAFLIARVSFAALFVYFSGRIAVHFQWISLDAENRIAWSNSFAPFVLITPFLVQFMNLFQFKIEKRNQKILYLRNFQDEWEYLEWIDDVQLGWEGNERTGRLNIQINENGLPKFSSLVNGLEWDSELVVPQKDSFVILYHVLNDPAKPNEWYGYLEINKFIRRRKFIFWREIVACNGPFDSLGMAREGYLTLYRKRDYEWLKKNHKDILKPPRR
jgi:hypothetical protein